MELDTKISIATGILTAIIFTYASVAIRDTPFVWYQTRLFGLISYFFLFMTVLIGELRVLSKDKSRLKIFRFHKPIAIFSLFLVLVHGFAAVADNYKWGAQLSFSQYLGFSFGDKWLTLLSFGTLAFYLMILVALTSFKRSVRALGYRRWKRIHYLSYLLFAIAFTHAAGLGTDIKHSQISIVIYPLVYASMLIVLSLFLARLAHGAFKLSDQTEINLTAVLFCALVIGAFLFVKVKLMLEDDIQKARFEIENRQKAIGLANNSLEEAIEANARLSE
ncbi:hypothetical protein D6825_01840, partial [Candidatus Woesearchaeota archaeon]